MPGILPAGGPVLIIHGDIFGGIKYIIGLLRCIALEVDRTQVWTVAKSTVAQECNAGRDRHRLQRSAAVKGVVLNFRHTIRNHHGGYLGRTGYTVLAVGDSPDWLFNSICRGNAGTDSQRKRSTLRRIPWRSGLLYSSLYGRKDRKKEKSYLDCRSVCNFRSDLLVWNQPGNQ